MFVPVVQSFSFTRNIFRVFNISNSPVTKPKPVYDVLLERKILRKARLNGESFPLATNYCSYDSSICRYDTIDSHSRLHIKKKHKQTLSLTTDFNACLYVWRARESTRKVMILSKYKPLLACQLAQRRPKIPH